jgi:hypothetical protein
MSWPEAVGEAMNEQARLTAIREPGLMVPGPLTIHHGCLICPPDGESVRNCHGLCRSDLNASLTAPTRYTCVSCGVTEFIGLNR